MFGITTPDAIAFGMLLLAVVAALKGKTQGDTAKNEATKSAAGVSIAGSIVDANAFGDYIKTLDKLAIAMNRHSQALDRQHEVKHTNALEELAEKIDKVLDHKRR